MPAWLNHAAIAAPRNGTTSHTVDPATGTVVAGAPFTPTAGNLLVCLVEGAVTSSTPAGWTLPAGGSAVNNSGLYLWYRTAAGDGDVFTTTHNGANYPVVFDLYEFPAGTSLVAVASAINVNTGDPGPTLTSLTETATFRAAVAGAAYSGSTPMTFTWDLGTEAVDTSAVFATTDGYGYSLTYIEDATSPSFAAVASRSAGSGGMERLAFALAVPTTVPASTGTLAGATARAGAFAGIRAPQGGFAGALGRVGAVAGATTRRGTLAGVTLRAGVITGSAPAVEHRAGAFIGATARAGTLTGARQARGILAGLLARAGVIRGRNGENIPPDVTLRLVAEHTSTITLVEHTTTLTIRERG